ncbi:hypothetical protein QN277_013760 [Acacia crassicarpa]|nr:hypothetical protein QN277_013760 [Acacia crassicarpa]
MAFSKDECVILIFLVAGCISLLFLGYIFWLFNYYRALHDALLNLLPSFTYTSSSSTADVCAICLTEFKEGDTGRLLPNCNHIFHHGCIYEWIKRSNTACPLCREVINPRTTSLHENIEASLGGEGQLENSPNINLPSTIWCPRNTQHVIVLKQVAIEIPEEDKR